MSEFLKLDHHEQILVFGGMKKIARDPVHIGKWLGNRGKGKDQKRLVNFKTVRIDKSNLEVYQQVAGRLQSISEFQRALLDLYKNSLPSSRTRTG